LAATKTIGLMNSSRFWGGGEKWHSRAATLLAGRGHRVVFYRDPAGELARRLPAVPGIRPVGFRVGPLSFANPVKVLQLARHLANDGIDTLLVNSPNELKLAGMSVGLHRRTRLVYRRGLPHPPSNSPINRFVFHRSVDCVIANSLAVEASLNARSDDLVPRERIVVIPNAIDVGEFESRACRPVAPKRDGVLHLGNAGRLVQQKNQRDLIELARVLQDRGTDFRVLIAGTGELQPDLERLATSREVTGRVEFVGFLENVKDLFESIHVLVFPSRFEGMSNVLIESLAAGVPIVAYDVSSNAEVIDDGRTGFLVPDGDVTALADGCIRLGTDRALRERMSEACREVARERFSEASMLRALDSIL
jgi:glycosyltransferase involved in cell wall biosynthesis